MCWGGGGGGEGQVVAGVHLGGGQVEVEWGLVKENDYEEKLEKKIKVSKETCEGGDADEADSGRVAGKAIGQHWKQKKKLVSVFLETQTVVDKLINPSSTIAFLFDQPEW